MPYSFDFVYLHCVKIVFIFLLELLTASLIILMFLHSEQILPALNLWEFFAVDVNKVVEDFKNALLQQMNSLKNSQNTLHTKNVSPEVRIVQNPDYERLGSTIDLKKSVQWYLSTK